MRHVRIRVELNKGKVGMPLDKLARVAGETVAFLGSLTSDLGVHAPEHAWLAENFDNGSVDFDCRFAIPLEDERATRLNSALRMVFANDYSDATTAMLIRSETRRRAVAVVSLQERRPFSSAWRAAPFRRGVGRRNLTRRGRRTGG